MEVLFFIYGLTFGSFFNVVGLRIPQKQSIISPPSHCPSCGNQLRARDLIPLLSWLLHRGKCRFCGGSISPIYPLMEAVTGILFATAFYFYGFTVELIMVLLFLSLLVIITVSDLAYRIIPDKVIFPFLGLFLILRFFIHPEGPYWFYLLGMVLGFGIFLLIAILSRGGMGGGDIKLFAVVGLFFGYKLLFLVILLSTFLGALYGIILILFNKAGRKTEMPFGPFIALACVITIFFGSDIIEFYWKVFF